MKRIIKNNYKFILGLIFGLVISITTVYAVDAYIESNKVTYKNHNKNNVQEAIDELYERSGIHQDKWVDPILNGADPILKEPLIPVEIKPNGDVYYASENSEWYNYSEKRWANAVILIDNPSNTNYQVGDHIIEDDIESYFVWIPRFKYKVWDKGNYNTFIDFADLKNVKDDVNTSVNNMFANAILIDIVFGDYDYVKVEGNTKQGSGISGGDTGVNIDDYLIHPAFTFGNKNLNGMWVGKFETGGSASNIVIKPNVKSWLNQNIKTYFNAAKEYETTLNSHMAKNTEWGAIAYLSHSAYGMGGKLNINNNSNYITGYSAAPNTDQSGRLGETGTTLELTRPYNTLVGYLASTTGNISGVYDMAGAGFEYVAACIDGMNSSSGFTTVELASYMDQGYIDRYKTATSQNMYNNRILGDAIGELGPFYRYYDKDNVNRYHNSWYPDHAYFITNTIPWLTRGGVYEDGSVGSQFSFGNLNGSGNNRGSFRLILSF